MSFNVVSTHLTLRFLKKHYETYDGKFSGSMFRNLDLSMLGPRIELPNLAPPNPPSPVTPAGKGVQVSLENNELWSKFHALNTEMIITKTGRFVIHRYFYIALGWKMLF